MGYWPYDRIFSKFKNNCTTFVETGTHLGDSVNDALNLGFERIISVEFDINFYKQCLEKFKEHIDEKVFLFHGDSSILISSMLELVDDKAMFWLDAHGNGGGNPFQNELEAISKHHIKNHVIIVDDVGEYGCDENYIIKKCIEINPQYKFEIDHCAGKQLIAYVN